MNVDEVTDNYIRLLSAARIRAGNPSAQAIYEGMDNALSHGTTARVLRGGTCSRHSLDLIAAYLTGADTTEHDHIMTAYDRDQAAELPLGPIPRSTHVQSRLPVGLYRSEVAAAIRDTGHDIAEAIRQLADTIRDAHAKDPDHH